MVAEREAYEVSWKSGCEISCMKAQMKQANRLAAKYVLILGEDEVARGCAVLRNMSTSEQTEIPIQDITSILKTEVQSHE